MCPANCQIWEYKNLKIRSKGISIYIYIWTCHLPNYEDNLYKIEMANDEKHDFFHSAKKEERTSEHWRISTCECHRWMFQPTWSCSQSISLPSASSEQMCQNFSVVLKNVWLLLNLGKYVLQQWPFQRSVEIILSWNNMALLSIPEYKDIVISLWTFQGI